MPIIWNDSLKTGISVIDEQHKFIIDALSGLDVQKMSKTDFLQLLMDLQAYLSVHFSVEEDYMKDADYPDYKPHKANHDKVLIDYKNISEKHSNDEDLSEFARNLVNYMEDWFVDHYANEDEKMAKYLRENLWRISQ